VIHPPPAASDAYGRPAAWGVGFVAALLPFIVLATLNSGGYRYGASDQAFYVPAVLDALDPELFPRDTPLLAAQTRLTVVDDTIAAAARVTGAPLPAVFAVLYVGSLALFAWGAWRIGRHLYRLQWTALALLAALTLRHAIARSGTNTLEGYFQPRLLAYALGALAIAAFLRRRLAAAAAAVLVAGALHPTTALWFALWLATATAIAHPGLRRWLAAGAAAAGAAAVWAVLWGPLAGRLVPLDPEWRRMLETKDYLFPLEWPAYAWILNLGYVPVILWLHRARSRAGLADRHERALVAGVFVLLAVFAAALVLHALDVALAFQLQPARIFWMFDFLAVIHVVWWLAEGRRRPVPALVRRQAALAAILVTALSVTRGAYVLYEAERPAVQLTIPDDDWGRAMRWARRTDKASGWLADPLHAVRYGTSVRVAGERDVFVEAVKDAALGMYDRTVAVRTDVRLREVTAFDELTAGRARALAARYQLDYLVTEQPLDLPVAFSSGPLRIYRLK